jgi:GntR family transcriptional regulator of arabinose operon
VENESKILRSFIDKKVDGIIVEGTKTALPNPNISLYKQLDQCGIPYVFINGFYRELPCIHITTSDRECGETAATYLIHDKHCEKLGGIFKSDDMQGHERYAGFAQGILKCRKELDDDAVIWFTTAEKDRLFLEYNADVILKRLEGCSGIVCYNDQIAYSLIKLLEKHDIRVPDDVTVVGYDNANLLEYSSLKITTFDHPKEKMGVSAANKIINLVENGKQEKSEVLKMNMIIK